MLRPYQSETIEAVRQAMRDGFKKILIESPTGSGKTVMTAEILNGARLKGKTAWFNVHRIELIEQTRATFKKLGIPHGIVSAGYPVTEAEIQICSVPTLSRRLPDTAPDLIAWDECHHIGAGTWNTIFEAYPDTFHIGMTATPIRGNGARLGKWFERMIRGKSIPWLIDNGYLSDFRYFAPSMPNLDGVSERAGDYDSKQLEHIMAGKAIVGSVVDNWKKEADGLMTIGFAPTINSSKAYTQAFIDAGVPAAHLDGKTSKAERAAVIKSFARGETKVLFNVDLFGEGFDIGSISDTDICIEAGIFARPTQSLTLDKQQKGRTLRPKPRPAIMLDHAGNWTRHGLPDDVINWDLVNDPQRIEGTAVPVTQCPTCYAVFRARVSCPKCGASRAVSQRKLHYFKGELEEIKRKRREEEKQLVADMKRQQRIEVGRAKTIDELIALGVKRGYEFPKQWAINIIRGRNGKRRN